MKDFDVIVIGSGIGGLISAGILSLKGLRTLLIEKNPTPGGYLASFRRNGFLFDSSIDCISGVAPGGLIYRVMELLRVDRDIHFVQINPIRVSIFPDMEVVVDADINAYVERLMLLFPSEGKALKKLFELLDSVYIGMQSAMNTIVAGKFKLNNMTPEILKLRNISYAELLDKYITDYRLKSILSDRCPFIGLPPSRVSALSMVNMIMSYFKLGAYRPVGGSQKLADALIKGIKNNGGKVILGNGTKKILLQADNSCCGIQCDNGDEYTSRFIISNADFHHTFSNLLNEEYTFIAKKMLENIGVSTSFFIVYAGIKGGFKGHSSIGYFPSYDMEGFFTHSSALKEDSTIGITVASIEDKHRSPELCHTVVFHEMVEASGERLDKSKCTDIVLQKAENIIPAIKERIMVIDSASPHTLQQYTGNFNGSAFGWQQIPGFKGIREHGIKNLYIAGHWGGMGGGVLAAAYSGAKAAVEILTKEGLTIDI
ncbi:MAG: phytoene desaturase family protein [Candidatus Brocadiales bacterium]